jgi:acetyl-CoA C-acetyltransferase
VSKVGPNTPVLVGIGVVNQRQGDHRAAKEPLVLMTDAVGAAAVDSGAQAILPELERIYVPKGRWQYTNPAGAIAALVGADRAVSVLAHIGVLQQTLIGDACRRIAEGEISVAAVVGGEASYRILRARIAAAVLDDDAGVDEPDEIMKPHDPMQNPSERAAGLAEAVGSYAIVESAYRAAHGWSVDEHRDRLAALYASFSRIAADNPYAWRRETIAAESIRNPSAKNAMLAFPYTKLHVSSWNVDQAAALIFCSAARAGALGISKDKWVLPLASTESNFMMDVSVRPSVAEVPGAQIAGRAALNAAGVTADRLDLLDLYTCFPVAVETYAEAIGIPLDRPDLTVTGGMPFAGGPLNNYVLQATARMGQMLRAKAGAVGLVTSVSGLLTKQGFGVWTSSRDLGRPFQFIDVSAEVKSKAKVKKVVPDYAGLARVAGYTVLHRPSQPDRAIVVVDIDEAHRAVAWSEDPRVAAAMEGADEFVGREVSVSGGRFGLTEY